MLTCSAALHLALYALLTHFIHGLALSLRSLPRGAVEIPWYMFTLKTHLAGINAFFDFAKNTPHKDVYDWPTDQSLALFVHSLHSVRSLTCSLLCSLALSTGFLIHIAQCSLSCGVCWNLGINVNAENTRLTGSIPIVDFSRNTPIPNSFSLFAILPFPPLPFTPEDTWCMADLSGWIPELYSWYQFQLHEYELFNGQYSNKISELLILRPLESPCKILA